MRRRLLTDSIYTMKLSRRGKVMPEALQANTHLVHHVSDIRYSKAELLPADAAIADLDLTETSDAPPFFVLTDDQRVAAVVSRQWALAHQRDLPPTRRLADALGGEFATIGPDATIVDLITKMQEHHASAVVVLPSEAKPTDGPPKILGVVTKQHIFEVLAEGMELFEK
jgi:CIC family chloride channel protein